MNFPGDLAERKSSRPLIAVMALAFASFALKIVLAWRYYGFLTGDDVEVVEGAGRYAWHLAYSPWSLRSMFHPLLVVAPFAKLFWLLGVRDPLRMSWVCTLPHALISSIAIVLLYLLAIRWRFSRAEALTASLIYTFHWLPLGYGAMQYPRPISTAMLLLALFLISEESAGLGVHFASGALIAAAFAIRFSEGMLLPLILIFIVWRRRRLVFSLTVAAGFAAGAIVFVGLFDFATWGHWFWSLREFFRQMYFETPPSSPHGDKPWYWYGSSILQSFGPVPIVLSILGLRRRDARLPLVLLLAFLGLMSLFQFKAYRYLQAGIPLLSLCAALGVSVLWRKGFKKVAVVAVALCVLYNCGRAMQLLERRSMNAIDAIRAINKRSPGPPMIVAIEQSWAYGDRLLLAPGQEILEIPTEHPLHPEQLRQTIREARMLLVYADDVTPDVATALRSGGFVPAGTFSGWKRSPRVICYSAGP